LIAAQILKPIKPTQLPFSGCENKKPSHLSTKKNEVEIMIQCKVMLMRGKM